MLHRMCRTDSLRLALIMFLLSTAAARANPTGLRCEGSIDPTGIDESSPRLSWLFSDDHNQTRGFTQRAYRILVASSAEILSQDNGDAWDSGRVESSQSAGVPYGGRPLMSAEQLFWKVCVWDSNNQSIGWSKPAKWTNGLLTPDDWRPAKWIGYRQANDGAADRARPASILLRKDFLIHPQLLRAVLFISGLGQYEASINGVRTANNILSPGWTEYRKTVLYDAFELTDQLHEGNNVIGIVLGDGMYNIAPTPGRYVKFTNTFGEQKAIASLRLTYADGTTETVTTDSTWQTAPSPITYTNIFGGEDFDARSAQREWDRPGFKADNRWQPARETEGPGGTLRGHSAAAPPIASHDSHQSLSSRIISPSVTVYDLGQNASHMPHLVVRGEAGSIVRVIPSELLGQDGRVDRASCVQDAGGPAWWQYTLDGSGSENYFPKFFYQGCRYFQVECTPAAPGGALPTVDSIEGVVVHSSAEPIGAFECSNPLFNQIYSLVRWAQRSNMMSLMTDCPQREKLGWLEELHLNGPSLRYNFRLDRLYTKQMNDMADAQLENGFVPNIAPEYFIASTKKLTDPFRNSPEWGSSFVIAPWQQYEFTGDLSLLRTHYPQMVKYVDFLASTAKDDIITVGLGDWYDIGPKPPWGSQLTPPPFTATAIYYYDNILLAQVAEFLNRPGDAARFRDRAARIRQAFNAKFYDVQKDRYATGSQCTSAIPLVLGLVEPQHRDAVLKALVDDIRARGNALSAGDVGYRFVLRALADAGRNDVIFDMNNQSDRPGYGMQIKRGATSLTEKWDASVGNFGSQNHFMLGQINEWFFHDLAGIQPDPAKPGFENVIIKPANINGLTWTKCTYESVRGKISVDWKHDGPAWEMNVTIPANTTATIHLRATSTSVITESGMQISNAPGVTRQSWSDGYQVLTIGSGTYRFAAR